MLLTHIYPPHQSSIDVKSKEEDVPVSPAHAILCKLFEDDNMFSKAPPRLILSRSSGGGPFAHLSYPVGGLHPLDGPHYPLMHTAPSSEDYLPGVVVPSEEAPASEAPQTATRRSVELTETIVELPPAAKKKASGTKVDADSVDKQGPSERVKEFLSRVPDLSFMLSSKLSRPTD